MAVPSIVAFSEMVLSASGLVELLPSSLARVARNALLVIATSSTLSTLLIGNILSSAPSTRLQFIPTNRDLHLAKIQHAIWKAESDKMLSENSDMYDASAGLLFGDGHSDPDSPPKNTFVPRPQSRWSLLNADNFYIGRSIEFMMHPKTLIDALDYVIQPEVQKRYRSYLDSVSVDGELSDTTRSASRSDGHFADRQRSGVQLSVEQRSSGNIEGSGGPSQDRVGSNNFVQKGDRKDSIEYNLHYRFFPIMFGMCGFGYSHISDDGVDAKEFLKAKLPDLPAYLKEFVPFMASCLVPIMPGPSLPTLSDIPGSSYLPAMPDLSFLISGIVSTGVAPNESAKDGRASTGPASTSSDGSKGSDTVIEVLSKQDILSNVYGVFSDRFGKNLI